MLSPGIREVLEQEESELHAHWLSHGLRMLDAGERHWSQRYDRFREAERLLRAYRDEDTQDQRTKKSNLTSGVKKIVVPYTLAVVHARVAFLMSVLTQRNPMIPVAGMGPNDALAAILHELILDYQINHMDPHGMLGLYQYCYDAERYGIAILKNHYGAREFPDLVRQTVPIFSPTGELEGVESTVTRRDVTAYEGNQWTNLSPYQFICDPHLPAARFQEGEFAADWYVRSFTHIRQKQAQGLYAGVQYINRGKTQSGTRGLNEMATRFGQGDLARIANMSEGGVGHDNLKDAVTIHELYWYADPRDLELTEELVGEDRDVVPEDTPTVWVMRIANRSRVIGLEPAILPGRRFPYEVIESWYDLHAPGNPGSAELLSGLSYHYSWLFNSRQQSVRRTINNQLVVDPSMVEEEDLTSDDPGLLIRLKRQFWQAGATRDAVFPLPMQDVTQSHIGVDAPAVRELIDTVSGNNFLLGQANTGRRSATEVQGQQQSLAARMKMVSQLQIRQGIAPLMLQMIKNNQVFLDQQTLGLQAPYNTLFGQPSIQVTPDMLQGHFTIPIGELGIPADQQMEASLMKELLVQGMQSGAAAQTFQTFPWDALLGRFLWRSGVKDLSTFGLTLQNLAALGLPQQVQVAPDQQVAEQAQAGNVVPDDGGFSPMGSDGFSIFSPDAAPMNGSNALQ